MAADECAEGVHVNLGLLPTALGCDCKIVILPTEVDGRISTIETRCRGDGASTGNQSSVCTLHLLLRPGHYDLLYARDKDWQCEIE